MSGSTGPAGRLSPPGPPEREASELLLAALSSRAAGVGNGRASQLSEGDRRVADQTVAGTGVAKPDDCYRGAGPGRHLPRGRGERADAETVEIADVQVGNREATIAPTHHALRRELGGQRLDAAVEGARRTVGQPRRRVEDKGVLVLHAGPQERVERTSLDRYDPRGAHGHPGSEIEHREGRHGPAERQGRTVGEQLGLGDDEPAAHPQRLAPEVQVAGGRRGREEDQSQVHGGPHRRLARPVRRLPGDDVHHGEEHRGPDAGGPGRERLRAHGRRGCHGRAARLQRERQQPGEVVRRGGHAGLSIRSASRRAIRHSPSSLTSSSWHQ
ncbi:conserved hypothetical protein [Frankia sp. Hr75.2]|nr:conserved hypothetical protein [Frankia sp. Hr75.2]